jgi:hypothetical protein
MTGKHRCITYILWLLKSHTVSITSHIRRQTSALGLANFVWLNWPLIIYVGQGFNEWAALLVTGFLSLSFPVEELAGGQFPGWKDPLAEMLYVF